MKRNLFILAFFIVANVQAGWFSSFQEPPVSLSMKMADWAVHITNTSDETIHEVVASSLDGKTKFTIADTVEPHKTVVFNYGSKEGINSEAFSLFLSKFTVTCKDYGSKKVELSMQ